LIVSFPDNNDNIFTIIINYYNNLQAVGVVSNCIARRDFSTLQGLVTNDVLKQVKSIVSNLSDKEIKDMAFSDEDIYLSLPCQLDVINDAKCKYQTTNS